MSQWRGPSTRLVAVLALVTLTGAGILAQTPAKKAVGSSAIITDDPDFARSVKEWTTRPEELTC